MSKVYEYLKQFEIEGPEHPDEMKTKKVTKRATKKRIVFKYKGRKND